MELAKNTNNFEPKEYMTDITMLSIERIAVFRAQKLGDFLVAIPALRALRAAFPTAWIDYIGLPWSAELVDRYGKFIDGFIESPGLPGVPGPEHSPGAVVDFLQTMQNHKYDLVLQMHDDGVAVNSLISLLGAKYLAGFSSKDGYRPNDSMFMEYPRNEHELLRLLRLLEFLGIESRGEDMEFPILDSDYEDLSSLKDYDRIRGKDYMCIHPGSFSSTPWPPEHFAAVADRCADDGMQVVLTGTAQERKIVESVKKHMKTEAVDMIGKTHLGSLAALLKESSLVVSNNTGVSHLAIAVDALSITVFTTADPRTWAPLDQTRHMSLTVNEAERPKTVGVLAQSLLKQERVVV